jgi:hypothetical protein
MSILNSINFLQVISSKSFLDVTVKLLVWLTNNDQFSSKFIYPARGIYTCTSPLFSTATHKFGTKFNLHVNYRVWSSKSSRDWHFFPLMTHSSSRAIKKGMNMTSKLLVKLHGTYLWTILQQLWRKLMLEKEMSSSSH